MTLFTVLSECQSWDVLPLLRLQIKRKNCIQKVVKSSFNFPVERHKSNIGKASLFWCFWRWILLHCKTRGKCCTLQLLLFMSLLSDNITQTSSKHLLWLYSDLFFLFRRQMKGMKGKLTSHYHSNSPSETFKTVRTKCQSEAASSFLESNLLQKHFVVFLKHSEIPHSFFWNYLHGS